VVYGRTPLGMSQVLGPQLLMSFIGILKGKIKVEGFNEVTLILGLSCIIEVIEKGRRHKHE